MIIDINLIKELQNRLKISNRRNSLLNAIPGRSRHKLDLHSLSVMDAKAPKGFLSLLLSHKKTSYTISRTKTIENIIENGSDIQSDLNKLFRTLENLTTDTKSIEMEKGVNAFGFGFPLLIRRDKSDGNLTVAPLIIWSLKIKRGNDFKKWIISRDPSDDIYINEVLNNHLLNDQKVDLGTIQSDLLEKGFINKDEFLDICKKSLTTINDSDNLGELDSLDFDNLQIKEISSKQHYEEITRKNSNSQIEFAGLFSIYNLQKTSIINDYEEIDLNNIRKLNNQQANIANKFQYISSIDTDPSQQSVLRNLNNQKYMIVQGPPGTGKSQTLTAMLINALENKKKTLVVCEKKTALDVLYKSLEVAGFGNYCTMILDPYKDRKNVVNSVRDRIDRRRINSPINADIDNKLDEIIQKLYNSLEKINSQKDLLGKALLNNDNWTNIVGKLIKSIRKNKDAIELDFSELNLEFNYSEYEQIIEIIRKGQGYFKNYAEFKEEYFINPATFTGENIYLKEKQFRNDLTSYKNYILHIEKSLAQYLGEYKDFANSTVLKQIEKSCSILTKIKNTALVYEANSDFFDNEITNTIWYKITSIFNKTRKKILVDQGLIIELWKSFKASLQENKYFELEGNYVGIDKIYSGLENIEVSLLKSKEDAPVKIDNELINFDLEKLGRSFTNDSFKVLIDLYENLVSKISDDGWFEVVIGTVVSKDSLVNLNSVIAKCEDYLKNENDLFLREFNWYNFCSVNSRFKSLIDQLLPCDEWEPSFFSSYLNCVLLKNSSNQLPVDDRDYAEYLKILEDFKSEQSLYINSHWLTEQDRAKVEFEDANQYFSVQNLYNKRSSSKHKRMSLRQIIDTDTELFTSYFPVILTIPEVSSNIFHGREEYFDFVLFDESSQLRLEDCLPSFLKGKQVIISGDEHQMPPSNYFSKLLEDFSEVDDDDDERNARIGLLNCESLLDFAIISGFEKKSLDFHYRSRHPYLIEFSNAAFYGNKIQALPKIRDFIPIDFISVKGLYTHNTNRKEAETVISILENNIIKNDEGLYPSVGIATFNIHQRNLIISLLNNKRSEDANSEFSIKIIELEKRGLFIKNLENIQGDERDILILSTTFGLDSAGRFYQRFGALNRINSYKLLNVLITRAKYKIFVCTSIPETYINDYKKFLDEDKNNKKGILYAYLAYAQAVSNGNEVVGKDILNSLSENCNIYNLNTQNQKSEFPFEEEVYSILSEHFDQEKLLVNYNFGGYKIDIVYKSSNCLVPLIAIECDGAAYHSREESYLYDIHRQRVLEKHGFIFYRIWSTNWWRNCKAETKKLIDIIDNIENKTYLIKSQYSLGFTRFDKESTIPLIETNPLLDKNENQIPIKNSNQKKYPKFQAKPVNDGDKDDILINWGILDGKED